MTVIVWKHREYVGCIGGKHDWNQLAIHDQGPNRHRCFFAILDPRWRKIGRCKQGHTDFWNGTRLAIGGPVDSLATIGRRLSFTARLAAVVSTALSVLMLLSAGGLCGWKLHGHYIKAEAARPVTPSLEFLHMTIATRTVQGLQAVILVESARCERSLNGNAA
ncbi:hypothetical protein [Burkholderia sp. S171]|uniref:hypothetical protein n=1 Tax=Burkholderia sp. S171 TaxID=1641860 RepID=UPI00131B10CF|nr:hypothetical protein [Burkholderia sp. S171]